MGPSVLVRRAFVEHACHLPGAVSGVTWRYRCELSANGSAMPSRPSAYPHPGPDTRAAPRYGTRTGDRPVAPALDRPHVQQAAPWGLGHVRATGAERVARRRRASGASPSPWAIVCARAPASPLVPKRRRGTDGSGRPMDGTGRSTARSRQSPPRPGTVGRRLPRVWSRVPRPGMLGASTLSTSRGQEHG